MVAALAILDSTLITQYNTGYNFNWDGYSSPEAALFGKFFGNPGLQRATFGIVQAASGLALILYTPGGQYVGTYNLASGVDEFLTGVAMIWGAEKARSIKQDIADHFTGNQQTSDRLLFVLDLAVDFGPGIAKRSVKLFNKHFEIYLEPARRNIVYLGNGLGGAQEFFDRVKLRRRGGNKEAAGAPNRAIIKAGEKEKGQVTSKSTGLIWASAA